MVILALGHGKQREGAIGQVDDHVVPLTHADQQGVGLTRLHRESVAVGDPQRVAGQRDPECCVGARVDQTDARPLAGLRLQRRRRLTRTAVDEVRRIFDVTRTTKNRRAVRLAHHHPATTHSGHGDQPIEHLIGGLPRPVNPVVQNHDPFLVVVTRLVGVVDDQDAIQPTVELDSSVRMEEVGAGVRRGELVNERPARPDRLLGDARDAVHVVAQGNAVPVDAGVVRQVVRELDPEQVAGPGVELRPRNGLAVGPGVHTAGPEVNGRPLCDQFVGDDPLAASATLPLCRGHSS